MASRKITLVSSDGESFDVDEAVAIQSEILKNMTEDDCVDDGTPLHNVTSKILAKVIEYCENHVDKPGDEGLQASQDAEWVKVVDLFTLFELLKAANYLDIKSLLDLTCKTVADMLKGKTAEEIRETFDIKNDFTPEEEEEVCGENKWVYYCDDDDYNECDDDDYNECDCDCGDYNE